MPEYAKLSHTYIVFKLTSNIAYIFQERKTKKNETRLIKYANEYTTKDMKTRSASLTFFGGNLPVIDLFP